MCIFRCTMRWFSIGTHSETTATMKLVKTSITSHSYHFCVWREQLRSTLLGNSTYAINTVMNYNPRAVHSVSYKMKFGHPVYLCAQPGNLESLYLATPILGGYFLTTTGPYWDSPGTTRPQKTSPGWDQRTVSFQILFLFLKHWGKFPWIPAR